MTDNTKDYRLGLSLNNLLVWLGIPPLASDIVLSGIETDSRKICRGDLFLALPGLASDGRDYIEAAVKAGAAAILTENSARALPNMGVPLFPVDDLCVRAGALISHCFKDPSRDVRVVGVTGTNGKSSIVYFLASLLDRLSTGCGTMGTLGQGRLGQLEDTGNTTADLLTTNQFIARMRDQKVGWMAMEVSSHGLDQGRVDGIRIDTAVFSNLTRDHLDYHGSMEAYGKAKGLLFARPELRHAVINSDDPWAKTICSNMLSSAASGHGVECLRFSLSDQSADIYLENCVLHSQGMKADIVTPWGKGHLETPLLGRFNLSNLLSAIAVLGVHGFPLAAILKEIPALGCVPGRLERRGGGEQPAVVVDYAHTPDALSSVLQALREHGSQQTVCVFGCGGDRDRGKRALMALAACEGADKVIVTTDNPRSEEPEAIIDDVLAGLDAHQREKVTVIVDRADAIRRAVHEAAAGDVVLIAGKGHEVYQEIKTVRYPFNDLDEVTRALVRREL